MSNNTQNMQIFTIIGQLEDMIERSPRPKLGNGANKRVIDAEEMIDLLGDLKVTTVSYTHLDVYKRQVSTCALSQQPLLPILAAAPTVMAMAVLDAVKSAEKHEMCIRDRTGTARPLWRDSSQGA